MENIILAPTGDRAAGRAVLRALDDLAAADAIEVRAAALVERAADGHWYLPEETEIGSYRGTLTGGAIGAAIALLGGPAGLLLGGAALLLAGSFDEVGDAQQAETIVHALGRLVPPGTVAALADVYETARTAVDDALAGLGVRSWRMTRAEAEAQLEAALGHDLTPRAPPHGNGRRG